VAFSFPRAPHVGPPSIPPPVPRGTRGPYSQVFFFRLLLKAIPFFFEVFFSAFFFRPFSLPWDSVNSLLRFPENFFSSGKKPLPGEGCVPPLGLFFLGVKQFLSALCFTPPPPNVLGAVIPKAASTALSPFFFSLSKSFREREVLGQRPPFSPETFQIRGLPCLSFFFFFFFSSVTGKWPRRSALTLGFPPAEFVNGRFPPLFFFSGGIFLFSPRRFPPHGVHRQAILNLASRLFVSPLFPPLCRRLGPNHSRFSLTSFIGPL